MAKSRRVRGEGTVFQNSKKKWVYRAVVGWHADGRVRYVEGHCRTQGEALRKKRAAERSNRQADATRATVAEYLTRWLESAKPNIRAGSYASYESAVRLHISPNIGGIRLAALTPPDISRLYAKLTKAQMSAGNVLKVSEVLATALESAVAEGSIIVSPARGAIKPRVVRPTVDVFTDEEVSKILTAAEGHPLESLFVMAIATGMRQGELFALDTTDINAEAGTVHVSKTIDYVKGKLSISPPKSRRGVRTIALPAFARFALSAHMAGREPGPLFTDSRGGHLRKSNFIRRDWHPLLKAAGVPARKFHTLRHTHASRLLAAGVDPAEVARRLGDGIDTLLKSYSHWMKVGQDTAAKVDEIYGTPMKNSTRRIG